MTFRLEFLEGAKADIAALPDRATQLAALRVALALTENPFLGEPLRVRARVGDLAGCRRVPFDREDVSGKPRFRLIYRNNPDDGSIEVLEVIAVGLRERLGAYRAATARLREEMRRRLDEPGPSRP